MAERDELLASIVTTTADYRAGDLEAPTPDHVARWVNQFDAAVQLPILREMDHVLKRTYFSRAKTRGFLRGLFSTEDLVGDDPCAFWDGVKFLDIQGGGASQKGMLALFDMVLSKECELDLVNCGADPQAFVYLDDASFTGNRVRRDVEGWIAESAPSEASIHIVMIALHSNGKQYAARNIRAAADRLGKRIKLKWWRAISLEDRRDWTDSSDVLRPTSTSKGGLVEAYVDAMSHKPHLRAPGQIGGKGIFSSDEGRQLLEQEFLEAGVKIRQMCPSLGPYQRPLGNSVLETLGFGSLMVTFRNCPNNAPLALWAGDPWYPLFPRVTNSETSYRKLLASLESEEF